MKIKKIILKNFQCHSDLEIDLDSNVNIISGRSDAGKSSIRRAVEFCLLNNVCSGLRKHDTKSTSVVLVFENGVEVERVRSASINRYILRNDGEEKVFDTVGRSVPEEISTLIGIEPIEVEGEKIYLNSYPQISLPFLYDKSPVQRMKIFNKLTGNEVLNTLFVNFNKNILRIGRDVKTKKEIIEKQEVELKSNLETKNRLEERVGLLINNLAYIKDLEENYSKLLKLKELNESNSKEKARCEEGLKGLEYFQDVDTVGLTKKIEDFKVKKTLEMALQATISKKSTLDTELGKLTIPEWNSKEIMGKITSLNELKTLAEKKKLNTAKNTEISSLINEHSKKVNILEKEYKTLLKEMKVCYVCGQKIEEINCVNH